MGEMIMENILLYNDCIPTLFTIKKVGCSIQWSDEQIQYIINKYFYDGASANSIAKQFKCSDSTIRRLLEKNNVDMRKTQHHKNSDYFEVINSREKAYWLGIMYSDGCVCKRSNGLYSISLEMIDEDHIKKFRNALDANDYKILNTIRTNFDNAKPSYSIHIYDHKMAEDLIRLGCVPKKSYCLSSVPNIPKDFIYDFLRGFIDGDGCICYNTRNDSYAFKLVGASPLFLEEVMKILEIDRLSLNKCSKKSYQVTSSKRDDVYRILTRLYDHSTEATRLNRKYNKYLEFIEWYKKKNE